MNRPNIEEKLSRIADEVRLSIRREDREAVVAMFVKEALGDGPDVPHMAGYPLTACELADKVL